MYRYLMIFGRAFLALPALLLALPAGADEARGLYAEAGRLERLGRHADALSSARLELARIESSSSTTVAGTARALAGFGKFARFANDDAAIQQALDRLAALPPDPVAVIERVKLLNSLSRFEEGLRVMTAAAAARPKDAALRIGVGDELRRLGRRAEAAEAYRRALQLAPDDYEAHLRLASAYRLDGRFEEASGLYRRAQALAPQRADAYFEEGYSRRDDGDAKGAVQVLRGAVAANPRAAALHHHLGMLLASEGRTEDAIESFETALRLYDPADGEGAAHTRNHLASKFHVLGRHDDALKAYQKTLADAPQAGPNWFPAALGCLNELLERGREAEGLALMDRALETCRRTGCHPLASAQAYARLSRALLGSNSRDSASYRERALKILEENPPTEVNQCNITAAVLEEYLSLPALEPELDRLEALGRRPAVCVPKAWTARLKEKRGDILRTRGVFIEAGRLERLGRPAEALAAAETALARIDFSSRTPAAELARVLGRFGELARAAGDREALEKSLGRLNALPPEPAVIVERAKILNRTSRFEEGLRISTAAAALHPENPGLRMQAAEALLGLGRRVEAVDAYRRVLALAPADYDAHLRLANVYRLEGRFEEASGLYRAAQSLAPGRADAYFEEGYSRRDEGDLKGAIRVLQAAVAANPKDPYSRHHLGVLLAGAGRARDAVRVFEAGLALFDPSEKGTMMYVETKTSLARQLSVLGRHAEALSVYEEALAGAQPRGVQWCTAAIGSLDEFLELGREAEGRALIAGALETCRKTGCPPRVDARLFASAARALAESDPPRAREYGHRALDLIEGNPPTTVNSCYMDAAVVKDYRRLPAVESEKDRLAALDRRGAPCFSPRRTE